MNDDDVFRVRVDMDEIAPRVREATDVVLRSVVVDPSFVFEEMTRGVQEIVAGLDVEGLPDAVLTELATRIAQYWGAWLFVGKAGAMFAERAGADHVTFSQFVDEMVDGWAAGDD